MTAAEPLSADRNLIDQRLVDRFADVSGDSRFNLPGPLRIPSVTDRKAPVAQRQKFFGRILGRANTAPGQLHG